MTQLATFTTTSHKRADVIEIVGRVDSSNAGELESAFAGFLADGRYNLVVDTSGVTYLSSAGVRHFVSTLKECNRKGGDLRLAAPSDRVQEVLQMAGLTSLFKQYDDQTSAVGVIDVNGATITIPAGYEHVATARAFVAQAAARVGYDEDAVFQLELATDEACTNIIEHAYAGIDNGQIELSYRVEADHFTIEIRDHGRVFSPTNVPDPQTPDPNDLTSLEVGGLGLHFMRQLMDELDFSFDPVLGNTLLMRKRLPANV